MVWTVTVCAVEEFVYVMYVMLEYAENGATLSRNKPVANFDGIKSLANIDIDWPLIHAGLKRGQNVGGTGNGKTHFVTVKTLIKAVFSSAVYAYDILASPRHEVVFWLQARSFRSKQHEWCRFSHYTVNTATRSVQISVEVRFVSCGSMVVKRVTLTRRC
jgi:hypothetical protein